VTPKKLEFYERTAGGFAPWQGKARG